MTKTVLVPVADGTEEIEAVCIIDVLRRAGAKVTVASVSSLQITASREVKLVADCVISDCTDKTYDLIVLPGGLPGAEHLRDSGQLIEMLKIQKQTSRLYAAICASPAIVFAHHGLIDDFKATCYPSLSDNLKNYQEEKVVVDDNCITSQGPATALPFALKLVELLFGDKKATEIAEALLVK